MLNLKLFLKKLPHAPGVYIYKNKQGGIIYVGKAIDLYRRVNSYFQKQNHDNKTEILINQIEHIEIIKVASEFEALLLEAKLIQQHQPKYNIIAKDDKSPLYIVVTVNEELPRLLFVRKKNLNNLQFLKSEIFGPFQSGKTARSLLKSIRMAIPYCTQKKRNGEPCFYTHIGLCKPCPSEISKLKGEKKMKLTKEYRHHIFQIRDILSGKSTTVLHNMDREMRELAKIEHFEEAALIRERTRALYVLLNQRFNPMRSESTVSQFGDIRHEELTDLHKLLLPFYPNLNNLKRIECIDISNIGGTQATGSLSVLIDGIPDTHEYRRFKILRKNTPNDFAMISEVVRRRFEHPEWPQPDLLVIDGGKGQVSSATLVIKKLKLNIPIIGLAKRYEKIIIPLNSPLQENFKSIRVSLTRPGIHVLQRIRDEAHRFALTYHRKLRNKSSLTQTLQV